MSSNRIRAVLMLGAGGIGMSALARYYLHQGLKVFGYDKTPTDLTNTLISEGAVIIFEDDEVQIQPWLLQFEEEEVLVVYTPAVPPDSKIYNYVINHSFKIIKRAEALGKITRNTINLSVAGTHGKTTTSCMLAHILKEVDAAAFSILGGISTNIGSNYYNPFESMEEQASFPSVVSVTEADEFDRSFLHLSPFMAAITNMDSDHLDVYGNGEALIESFLAFARRVDKKGVLFIHHSVQHHFMGVAMDADIITYGIENGQIMASNVHINKGRFVFDLILEGEIHRHMVMGMPGKHNIENALAAIAMANELDIDMSDIRQAIASYKGVKRRFEYRVNS
ncbi:MAG: UDP-N-acetylmuramate--alanine ligase, partial [Bacteroidia bacterium]